MTSWPCCGEQRGGHRRIDAARHGDDDAHTVLMQAASKHAKSLIQPRQHCRAVRRVRLRSFSTSRGSFSST